MQRYTLSEIFCALKRTCLSFFVITKVSFSGPSLSYFISFVYSFTILPYIFVFLLSSDSHEQKCSYDKHDETNKSTQQIVMRKSIHVMRPFVYCSVLFHKTCLFKYHVSVHGYFYLDVM